jgi:diacylglycerol O-acyltransferase / wax synthase
MAADALKRRLSSHDAIFLHWERRTQPMHVGECMVYEGRLTAGDIIELLEQRMHLLPRYRQKVAFAPLGLSHPVWVDDPDFDLRHHVEERDLPAPGDDRVLSRVGGEIFGTLLDRDRPLWHITVLHGHESGDTVAMIRLHHAMVDGVSSVDLIEYSHDDRPDAPPPPPPDEPWEPRPAPGAISLARDAVGEEIGTVARRVWGAKSLLTPGGALREVKQAAGVARTVAGMLPVTLRPPPATPFNRPIGAGREFAWLEKPFDDMRLIRGHLGGTVNDVVLTILSGALARYLRRHGQETEGLRLRAMCPVSMRDPSQKGTLGNLVSLMVVPLEVGIDDPVERLRRQSEQVQEIKGSGQPAGIYGVMRIMNSAPPTVHALAWRVSPTWFPFPLNIVSTNVPGPPKPLYLGGHELLHWYPLGVPWTTLGLFLCTLTYRERVTMGLVVDPKVVPEVWEVVEDFRAAFEELHAAAAEAADATAGTADATAEAPADGQATGDGQGTAGRARARPKRRSRARGASG